MITAPVTTGMGAISGTAGPATVKATLAMVVELADEAIDASRLHQIADALETPAAASMQLPAGMRSDHFRELAYSGARVDRDWTARIAVDELRRWLTHSVLDASTDLAWAAEDAARIAGMPIESITATQVRDLGVTLTHARTHDTTFLSSVPVGDAIIAATERQVPATGREARGVIDAIRAAHAIRTGVRPIATGPAPTSARSAAATTPELATIELLARVDDQPRGDDLRELASLSRQLRGADGDRVDPGISNIFDAAANLPEDDLLAGYVPGYVDAVRELAMRSVPDRPQRVERAAAIVAAGDDGLDDLDRIFLQRAEPSQLDALGLDPAARLRLDAWLVGQPVRSMTPAAARLVLEHAGRVLDQLEPTAHGTATRSLLDDTRSLVERNLRRVAGTATGDEAAGLARQPDYAELGQVQARVRLLRTLDGPVAGSGTTISTAPRTTASAAAEQLAW